MQIQQQLTIRYKSEIAAEIIKTGYGNVLVADFDELNNFKKLNPYDMISVDGLTSMSLRRFQQEFGPISEYMSREEFTRRKLASGESVGLSINALELFKYVKSKPGLTSLEYYELAGFDESTGIKAMRELKSHGIIESVEFLKIQDGRKREVRALQPRQYRQYQPHEVEKFLRYVANNQEQNMSQIVEGLRKQNGWGVGKIYRIKDGLLSRGKISITKEKEINRRTNVFIKVSEEVLKEFE